MDQLSGLDASPKDFHLAIPAHGAPVGVADTKAGGKGFEPRIGHFIQIPDAAVGDGAYTAQRAMGIAVYLAPSGADEVRFVQILYNHDLRSGNACDVFPVGAGVVRLFVSGVAGLDHHGDGPANHGAHLGHEIRGRLEVECIGGDVL